LRQAVDRLGDALPDGRKPPTERRFYRSDLVMERRVARREQSGDLGDAEERIGVEDKGDEELTGGEFRIVEQCASSVGGFPVTATAPDTVGAVQSLEAVGTTVWQVRASQTVLRRRSTMALSGSGRNSITPSSASSASLWPKAGRSLHMSVSAQPEALILLVPPVY